MITIIFDPEWIKLQEQIETYEKMYTHNEYAMAVLEALRKRMKEAVHKWVGKQD